MQPSGLTLTLILATALCVSSMCSLVKSAQFAFSAAKLEPRLETRARKRLEWLLSRNMQVFIGISMLGTVANILIVLGVILFLARNGVIAVADLLLGVAVAVIPLLAFFKAIPEAIGRIHPERIMSWALPFLPLVYWLLCWVIAPVYSFAQVMKKALGEDHTVSSPEVIEKELLQVVSEGEKEGLLQESEKEMITAIIELKDSAVKEVMTPRIDTFSLPISTPLKDAITTIIRKGYSRVPLYVESRDDIVGVLYSKDLLRYWDDENRNKLKLADIMRKPFFVPETQTIRNLLRDFQRQKTQMAIVLDEYGGTAGIVTVEDIVEEIVGEIADEYDQERIEPITYHGENIIEVDARVRVSEVNEALQIDLPIDEGYETIVGFLLCSMGRIPRKDEIYRYKNIEFVILDGSERRITRVKVTKEQKSADSQGESS